MRRPQMLSTGRLVGAALAVCAFFIFFLDMTPLRAAADGAAYAVVVAIAGYFRRRVVIWTAALASVLTIAAPLLGAENDETLLQVIAGRAMGLTIIAIVAVVLVHLLDLRRKAEANEQEMAIQDAALIEMTRAALFADTPLKERFEHITELVCKALDADTAAVAQLEAEAPSFTFIDIWDRRLGRHLVTVDVPASIGPEFRLAIERGAPIVADDVTTSEFHQNAQLYFTRRGIQALLHIPTLYRERSIASLGVSHAQPHHWTAREIAFAQSVSHIISVLFSTHHAQKMMRGLDLVSQSIFVEGPNGKVEYANRRARELSGSMKPDGVLSVPFALNPLVGESDQQEIVFAGREFEIHRMRLPDSEVLIRVHDVTTRNAARAETKRMEARLQQSAKLQAMGQLAAGVAHDFNNLLAAIMGFAHLLAKALRDRPTEYAFAERILGVCKKGQGLTQEVLAFARTSSVERSPADLALVLGNSIDVISGEEAGSAQLSVSPSPEPLPVLGNSVQLMQLIQNLVVNAKHACEGIEGHVTVSAGRATPQEIYTLIRSPETQYERLLGQPHLSLNYCFLRVADNGHGIPPEILGHIFEPFFTTKGRRQGSGLGLAVVHGVVESHGGCCHVRSEPEKGTTFTIYLPLLEERIPDQPATVPEQMRAVTLHGTEKILIVDDDVELAEALTTGLEQLGYGAIAFDDPLEALNALRARPDDFDVLVTDHFMPKMHGTELVSAVRTTHTAIKIVLCSGANMPGLEQAARTAGADAFLCKPFAPEDVAYQIRTLLGDKTVQAA